MAVAAEEMDEDAHAEREDDNEEDEDEEDAEGDSSDTVEQDLSLSLMEPVGFSEHRFPTLEPVESLRARRLNRAACLVRRFQGSGSTASQVPLAPERQRARRRALSESDGARRAAAGATASRAFRAAHSPPIARHVATGQRPHIRRGRFSRYASRAATIFRSKR